MLLNPMPVHLGRFTFTTNPIRHKCFLDDLLLVTVLHLLTALLEAAP
jgi:hypothetical protein